MSRVTWRVLIFALFQVLPHLAIATAPVTCDQTPVVPPCAGEICEALQVLNDLKAAALEILPILLNHPVTLDTLEGNATEAFKYYIKPANLSTDPSTVRFYLYTDPANPNNRTELVFNDVNSIKNSGYNRTRRLIMLTHGFQAYLTRYKHEANIVLADWSGMSGPNKATRMIDLLGFLNALPTYAFAATNVYYAATRYSEFVKFLYNNSFIRKRSGAADVHLIGHSLGAHVMAMCALGFYNGTSIPIFRLSSTDPAGPLFSEKPTCQRFSSNLALHVDSVHTNVGEFGIAPTENLAKVRFLVNGGGLFQPWCVKPGEIIETTVFCSHQVSAAIYALSLRQEIYGKCDTGMTCHPHLASLGENLSNCANGQYSVNYTGPLF